MFARIPEEQILEVGTTDGEDEFVGGEVVFPAGDCHVYELFLMAQIFSKLEKTLVVVFPPALTKSLC